MTTAFGTYQEPIDEMNELDREYLEQHSWDREIERLHEQDEAGVVADMEGGECVVFELEDLNRWAAERQRAREEDAARVEELMPIFEGILEKGKK